MMNGAVKSKTIWIAAITAGLGAVLMYMPLLQEVFEPKDYGMIMIVLGVLQGVIRVYTTQSLKDK